MSVLTTCINAYLDNKKIIFFGAGHFSYSTVRNLGERISYFCDNAPAKQGTKFMGIPVYSPEKLSGEDRENTVIIINTEYYNELIGQLQKIGFSDIYCTLYKDGNEKIPASQAETIGFLKRKANAISASDAQWLRDVLYDDLSKKTLDKLIEKYKKEDLDFTDVSTKEPIYFNEIFRSSITENEVYIDAGAFDGKTVVDFIFYAKGKYKKIYAFEPDAGNYIALSRDLCDCRDIEVINAALSNKSGEASFDMRGTASSKIADSGIDGRADSRYFTDVKTLALDSFVKEPVTFIKMDIEGGEADALTGAQEIIKRDKPKLAISVYHRDDDLIKIPRMIHEMVPEYRLYLRHHTPINVDTVLYAMV